MADLKSRLIELSTDPLPHSHITYLEKLKEEGFNPKVIYDIGACVLQWTTVAQRIWPNAEIIAFDAFEEVEFLWKERNINYYLGVLSDSDTKEVKFYQNDFHPHGSSYYREIGCNDIFFPSDKYILKKTKTLDTVVNEKQFPYPDLVKIDCQGSEIDILKGGINTLKKCSYLIVELQHIQYNEGALLVKESKPIIEKLGWTCINPLFSNNGPDGDYAFINQLLKEDSI